MKSWGVLAVHGCLRTSWRISVRTLTELISTAQLIAELCCTFHCGHLYRAGRTRAAAEALAAALGGGAAAAGLDELASGGVTGDVLLNTTSVGMAPATDATPVPQAVLGGYALVFDAIYTPLETRLLRARPLCGCLPAGCLDEVVARQEQASLPVVPEVLCSSLQKCTPHIRCTRSTGAQLLRSVQVMYANALLAAAQEAKEAGCKVVSGLEMFVGQAVQQYELFTGQPAPADVMRAAVLDSMRQ